MSEKKKKIVFIADFFAVEVPGGGELNNEELIHLLSQRGYPILKMKSQFLTRDFIEENSNEFFIVANFVGVSEEAKKALEKVDYIIYEHDHKYLKSRNPADYPEYKAPDEEKVNVSFYSKAKAVLCQSAMHKSIVDRNIEANTVSLSGNLWSEESLNIMSDVSEVIKNDKYAVMQSSTPHKNTQDAVRYCAHRGWKYDLIPPMPYEQFLKKLGEYSGFVFFPKTPETLSRVAVEAKMMGLKVVTNSNLGASSEDWFKLKGYKLIDKVGNMRNTITDIVERIMK